MVKKLFFMMSIVVLSAASAMFRNRSATVFPEAMVVASGHDEARSRRHSATVCPEVYKLVAVNTEFKTEGELILSTQSENFRFLQSEKFRF